MIKDEHLRLQPVDGMVCRVLTPSGTHVGNLKLIGSVWKFKAIGYDTDGSVIPGGGPLTTHHNTPFALLDEALISAVLSND